jgi:hypothetical protein
VGDHTPPGHIDRRQVVFASTRLAGNMFHLRNITQDSLKLQRKAKLIFLVTTISQRYFFPKMDATEAAISMAINASATQPILFEARSIRNCITSFATAR